MLRSKTATLLLLIPITLTATQERIEKCPKDLQVPICSTVCYSDQECAGIAKCCRTACGGTYCVDSVKESPQFPVVEKYGRCPSPPTGPWVCSSRCSSDSDCRGKKKCCRNRCGAMACFNPVLPIIATPY